MSTKHTPFTQGPWHVGERKQASVVYDESGYAIANAEVYHGKHSYDESLANARLIAAAPELLEALRALVEMADEKVTVSRTHEIASQARAALEKAGCSHE